MFGDADHHFRDQYPGVENPNPALDFSDLGFETTPDLDSVELDGDRGGCQLVASNEWGQRETDDTAPAGAPETTGDCDAAPSFDKPPKGESDPNSLAQATGGVAAEGPDEKRASWQAGRAAINFPESDGPFLPPRFIDDATARELFQSSDERDLDRLVTERTGRVEALAAELQAIVPEVHETVRAGMQRGIEQGYVPAAALERLEPAFTQTAIQVVDQSALRRGDLAAYDQVTDTLTIGTHASDYDPAQTIVHEIGGHKISGGTFATREDGTTERVRRGFVNYEEGVIESNRHYGLDEAVQHHLALSYAHGQFEILDPEERDDRNLSYYDHRKLLAEFVLRSGGVVDLRAITRGSFEDSGESGAVTTDRRTMVTQARAAYGPGAYYKLDLLLESIDFYDLPAEELAERIHGPEFNDDGSVRRPGFIDTAGLT